MTGKTTSQPAHDQRHELLVGEAVPRRHKTTAGLAFSYKTGADIDMCKDTVLPSVSPSRRWKLPSTPSTSALSAERPASSATPSVSGTASPASVPLRKLFIHDIAFLYLGEALENGTKLTIFIKQWRCLHRRYSRRCCHALHPPKIARDCRGVRGVDKARVAGWRCFHGLACISHIPGVREKNGLLFSRASRASTWER